MTPQRIKDTIQAIKEEERQLKEGETVILFSLSTLIKIGSHEIYK